MVGDKEEWMSAAQYERDFYTWANEQAALIAGDRGTHEATSGGGGDIRG